MISDECILSPLIDASAEVHGLHRQIEQFKIHLAQLTQNPSQEKVKTILEMVFIHFRRDPSVVSAYIPPLRSICQQFPSAVRILTKSISKRGRCPRPAHSEIRTLLESLRNPSPPVNRAIALSQEISERNSEIGSSLSGLNDSSTTSSLHRSESEMVSASLKSYESATGNGVSGSSTASFLQLKAATLGQSDSVARTLDALFLTPSHIYVSSAAGDDLKNSLIRVRKEIDAAVSSISPLTDVPQTVDQFVQKARNDHTHPAYILAQRFVSLSYKYVLLARQDLFYMALSEYTFAVARQSSSNNRKARPYLQVFLWSYSRMPIEGQRDLIFILYQGLAQYFGTYNFFINLKEPFSSDIADRFYSGLIRIVSVVNHQKQDAALGHCITTISRCHSSFTRDLINRLKTRNDDSAVFPVLCNALCDESVFKAAPYECVQLLSKMAPARISDALCMQSYSSAESRRVIASALLAYACEKQDPSLVPLLKPFASRSGISIRKDLAFSLLVEPLARPFHTQGAERKAELVTAALGVFSDPQTAEYFRGRMTEIGNLLERQSQTTDPNVRGTLGFSILETVRLGRKWLAERTRGNFKEDLLQFFRTVEGYVTTEQAKLIRDTVLELALVSTRAVYSPGDTRITIEIRNIGHGTADGLQLELAPVANQYEVDERHRVIQIESFADQVPLQRDVWIRPLVAANTSIDVSITLRYNTLKERGKIAGLPEISRTVWLYPEAQYIRVLQPYSIGEPATTWFYGRQHLLDSMADNLRYGRGNDNSMIVYGLKRAGKTSILKRFISHVIPNRASSEQYIPIYIDLLREPKLTKDDNLLLLIARWLCGGVRRLLPPSHVASNISKLDDDFRTNPTETFSFVLEEIVDAIAPKRLLLALDEFSTLKEWIEDNGGSNNNETFGFLSNTLQSEEQLTMVFTGTYVLLETMRSRAFDLAKACVPYMVGFLEEQPARRLVEEPVERDARNPDKGWLEYAPRAVDRIVYLTNRHPYLIQYLCMQLVDRMNKLRHNTVNLNDVELVSNEVVLRPMHEMSMTSLWNEFSHLQHAILSIIASASESTERGTELREISRLTLENIPGTTEDHVASVCESLADAEMLERLTGSEVDSYRITIPIYHNWLRQNKPIDAVTSKR